MFPTQTSGPSTSQSQILPPDRHEPEHDLQVPDDAPAPPPDMFDPASASASVSVTAAAEAQLQMQQIQMQVGGWWSTATVDPPQQTQNALLAMRPLPPQPQPYISTFDPPPQSIALASTFDPSNDPSACTTASNCSNTGTWDISHSPLTQTHQATTSSWETYPFPPLPFFPDTPAVYANPTATAPGSTSVSGAAGPPDSAPVADDLAGVTVPVPVLPFRTAIDGNPSHPSALSLSLASFSSLGEDDPDMPLSAVASSWSSEPSSSALDSAVAMMAAMSGNGTDPVANAEGLVSMVSDTGNLTPSGANSADAQPLQWQGNLLGLPGGSVHPATGFTSDLLPRPPPSQFLDEEPVPSFPIAQWDFPLPGGHSFFPRIDPSRPTSRGQGKERAKSGETHSSPPSRDSTLTAVPACDTEGPPENRPIFSLRDNMSTRFETLAPSALPAGLDSHLAPPLNFSLQPPPPEFMLGVRPSTSLPLLTHDLTRYGTTATQLAEAPRVNGWIPPQERAVPPRPRRPVASAFFEVICPREFLPGAPEPPMPQNESMSPEDDYRMRRGTFAPSVNTSANVWSHLPSDFDNDQDDSPPLTPSTPRSPSYEREMPVRIPTVPTIPAPAPPPVRYPQPPPTGTVSNGSSPRSKAARRKKGSMTDKENKSSPKSNRVSWIHSVTELS